MKLTDVEINMDIFDDGFYTSTDMSGSLLLGKDKRNYITYADYAKIGDHYEFVFEEPKEFYKETSYLNYLKGYYSSLERR